MSAPAKFVQIAATTHNYSAAVFALDENGRVWRNDNSGSWVGLPTTRWDYYADHPAIPSQESTTE